MLFKRKSVRHPLKKEISVYISDKHNHLIIAPRFENKAGILYEQPICFATNELTNYDSLGTAMISNLNLFAIKDANLRDAKLDDWPAFKHSLVKTVKAFEQDYIAIYVSSANKSNLILLIEGLPYKESKLTIKSTISFHAELKDLGERLMEVYQACRTKRIA